MLIKRDFLDLDILGAPLLRELLSNARALKLDRSLCCDALRGRTLVMVFEAPSTRTRVSFDIAMRSLGGQVISLSAHDMQLQRGESASDTAHVLSLYADLILLRTDAPSRLRAMVDSSRVSVINGLTRASHPCQVLADIMTFEERLGSIEGETLSYFGDGSNNVAATWLQAAGLFGLRLRIACPSTHAPDKRLVSAARDAARGSGGDIIITEDIMAAARGSRAIMTDVWVSMDKGDRDGVGDGDMVEGIMKSPHNSLLPYRVDERVMGAASSDAIFMHCLPAHRGEEVTAGVIDGERSAVWDEAENRMHVQKAILLWCCGVDRLD